MRSLMMALALSLLALPTLSHAASLRCGTHVVADGATKATVLAKCGEPQAKDSRTETTEKKSKEDDTTTTKKITHKTIEEWTYNFGRQRLMQVVIFENGVLTDVKSTTHGH